MLIFIDESGDTGQQFDRGSSRFFVVVLVAFADRAEALACDRRINELRAQLGRPNMEFHFKRNSDSIRRAFLAAVAPYSFFYYGILIDKPALSQTGLRLTGKTDFYHYACGLVFASAKTHLARATVVIDETGSLQFKRQLAQYLRRMQQADGQRIVAKLKLQRSASNNLLQLADYVAGSLNRSLNPAKKDPGSYRRLIAHREMMVEQWPK